MRKDQYKGKRTSKWGEKKARGGTRQKRGIPSTGACVIKPRKAKPSEIGGETPLQKVVMAKKKKKRLERDITHGKHASFCAQENRQTSKATKGAL